MSLFVIRRGVLVVVPATKEESRWQWRFDVHERARLLREVEAVRGRRRGALIGIGELRQTEEILGKS
jgi:hypothetical protein